MDRRYRKKMERYWEKERSKALADIHSLDIESWFDFWHMHPDWKFKGNRDSETRAWVTSITYNLLQEVEATIQSQAERLQVWATICENTGDNSIIIHSENPNNTSFPYEFTDTKWGVDSTPDIDGIINHATHEIGKKVYEDEVIYYIRKKA